MFERAGASKDYDKGSWFCHDVGLLFCINRCFTLCLSTYNSRKVILINKARTSTINQMFYVIFATHYTISLTLLCLSEAPLLQAQFLQWFERETLRDRLSDRAFARSEISDRAL